MLPVSMGNLAAVAFVRGQEYRSARMSLRCTLLFMLTPNSCWVFDAGSVICCNTPQKQEGGLCQSWPPHCA